MKWFHVIILNGHMVFTATTDRPTFKIPQDGWTNTSNHDSCYREGINGLTQLGFDVCDEAWKNYKGNSKEGKLSITDFKFCTGFSKVFKLVSVELANSDDYEYLKDITSVKEL